MAAQQTSYSLAPTATGYAGQISDSRDANIRGYRNDLAASAEAAYGLAVCKSSASDNLGFGLCITSTQFLGVLAHAMDHEQQTTGLPSLEFGNVMREGRMWVKAVHNVTTASPVRVFIADYSGTTTDAVQGAFGTTLVTNYTAVLANARYLGAASAGGLVEVEISGLSPNLLSDSDDV